MGLLLHLQTRLHDSALQPQYICATCNEIIDGFLTLRQRAVNNEKIVLKYQLEIAQKGLKEVLEQIKNTDEYEENEIKNTEEYEENEKHGEMKTGEDDEDAASILKPESFQCNQCEEVFSENSILKHHMKTKHPPNHECSTCNLVFKRKHSLIKHKKSFHDGLFTPCDICDKLVKDLGYHKRSVHKKILFNCESCGKSYTSKSALDYHKQRVHSTDSTDVCQYCAAELSVKSMKLHIKLKHSGQVERTIPCQHNNCSKLFRTNQQATVHYKTTHLNMKEMCCYCNKEFKNLVSHISQIHKQSKHTCDQCGKSFSKNHDMKLHKERIHYERRYMCPVCGKRLSKIQEHMRRIHPDFNYDPANIQIAPPASASIETRILTLPVVKDEMIVLPFFS
ncbi:zinc finger protein 271 [Eurytemora carolleeae]|uniref:zinc finger protein 271 n=1 Tax=Eurytemora carolleeae TaxID=1294199 RepID=UPI000C774B19|nr:zinc finger protein 271 [Eurytemora carolleeae]|eukprot:XP_023342653.1 zinc finger protein 271-like [Eurytemora affinis]